MIRSGSSSSPSRPRRSSPRWWRWCGVGAGRRRSTRPSLESAADGPGVTSGDVLAHEPDVAAGSTAVRGLEARGRPYPRSPRAPAGDLDWPHRLQSRRSTGRGPVPVVRWIKKAVSKRASSTPPSGTPGDG